MISGEGTRFERQADPDQLRELISLAQSAADYLDNLASDAPGAWITSRPNITQTDFSFTLDVTAIKKHNPEEAVRLQLHNALVVRSEDSTYPRGDGSYSMDDDCVFSIGHDPMLSVYSTTDVYVDYARLTGNRRQKAVRLGRVDLGKGGNELGFLEDVPQDLVSSLMAIIEEAALGGNMLPASVVQDLQAIMRNVPEIANG